MKASDIPDERILSMLTDDSWVTWFAIAEALPEFPKKVVQAKLRSLERRKLAFGCVDCGCTGWRLWAGWPEG
jgi:hypothetical protein